MSQIARKKKGDDNKRKEKKLKATADSICSYLQPEQVRKLRLAKG